LKSYPKLTSTYNWYPLYDCYVNYGYNKVVFKELDNKFGTQYHFLAKGTIIVINFLNDIGAINENKDHNFNDFYLNNNNLRRINGRFYFNVLIDTNYYLKKVNVDIYFPIFDLNGNLALSSNLIGSNYQASIEYQVKNSEHLFILKV
jgi:hypothetical protein